MNSSKCTLAERTRFNSKSATGSCLPSKRQLFDFDQTSHLFTMLRVFITDILLDAPLVQDIFAVCRAPIKYFLGIRFTLVVLSIVMMRRYV
jgi:hypothetical protein